MADIKFVDQYVQLQRSLGNESIWAWKTPTGEVYYGTTPRATEPTTPTSVPRVSQAQDTTVVPTDVATEAPAAPAAPKVSVQSVAGDGGRDPRKRSVPSGGGNFFSFGDGDLEYKPPSTLKAEHEQYLKDQEQIQGVKDFFATTPGQVLKVASPTLAALGAAAAAGPEFIRSTQKESRASTAYERFNDRVNAALDDPNLSNDDFWGEYDAAMQEYDLLNLGYNPQQQAAAQAGKALVDTTDYGTFWGQESTGGDSGGSDHTSSYEGSVARAANDSNISDDDFWSGYEKATAEYDKANTSSDGGDSSGGKIVCTAMNSAYGFGSFRNAIWIKYARDNLTEYHTIGYHTLFLPLVDIAYNKNYKWLRAALEHIARHRTVDIWKLKKGKRDFIGAIERAILEPLCFAVGYIKKEIL